MKRVIQAALALAGAAAIAATALIAARPAVLAQVGLAQNEPKASAVKLSVPPTRIGINLTGMAWYSGDRAFANLFLAGQWQLGSSDGWHDYDRADLKQDGNLRAIPTGKLAMRMLTWPDTGPRGANIRCTYAGNGKITIGGALTDPFETRGKMTFRWVNRWNHDDVWLNVSAIDPANPITDIDCRETSMPADARYAPAYVASLKGYKVLRFMDFQRTNANAPVTWATRHTPASTDLADADGVAVEDMVELANATGADAWFTVPWNADRSYIEGFARYVHDHLAPGRQVYVELGNEVWNGMFPAAQQALREGEAAGLAKGYDAQLARYAQHTIEVMQVWEKVFADQPSRLVRVVSTQDEVPARAQTVLGYRGLASHVDALATAPYFGKDVMREGQTTDLDEIFRRLRGRIDETIAQARANKAIAARFGKRYLAYEAGQHVVLDVPLETRIQRDPRMYDLYKTFIGAWRQQIGDTLMLFGSVGGIGPSGAWGLAEHSGQSPADAPKLRAALEERDR